MPPNNQKGDPVTSVKYLVKSYRERVDKYCSCGKRLEHNESWKSLCSVCYNTDRYEFIKDF